MRVTAIAAALLSVLAACKSTSVPPAFETPSATINTLFRAYDVQDVPQQEIRRRLEARERFELIDEGLFFSCFSDWQGDHDQGLGGFVFGQLVAGKDELAVEVDSGTARVRVTSASPDLPPVILVKQEGGWKIDLRQSVPPDIRQRLYEVYRRARRAERRAN
ncbi:MAG: hypothetical protein WBG86_13435 [Polyangiales bacterium]